MASLSPDGRVVMISGAARGLGLAVTRRLVGDGFTVSLGARDIDALRAAHATVPEARRHFSTYDATDPATAESWVGATIERFGRIDALINNAGILRQFELEDSDAEDKLDELYRTNVRGPLTLTRLAFPHLRRSGQGRVVNINSLSGLRVGRDDFVGYSMSKFALSALSHATRKAGFADGVRATNLCPSLMDTEMVEALGAPEELKIRPDSMADMVSMLLALPNTASVAELPINVFNEPGY
ncbi:MAG: SDR family NAD(P)-dependent oxidoreductase [Proteobacteria bacterium]|nr:SDR family NAD(P)-dependent oxidoreductase [Pseudomonadota bacterium]